ncbi:hypothetical protein SAMN05444000_111131 [Shimia gijangensis]|uniref:Phosphoadenosine phosphosulfate reductase n=1 Tax=Shimia gijangensis TaxID=1470563 RepID=A0A1M6LAJ6_9RHOB|nr:phosphoadenosine phosphosulfate reductase [Shimia gijangensis]SHJ68218.1 hypothetical protein SAMN05444000_111131 [Shimia gijangensis]
MQDMVNGFDVPMLGLGKSDWLETLENIVDEHGYFQPLGDRHYATLVEEKPILLVTFETIQGVQNRGDSGQPLGFELVRELGWSHLCVLSDGDTWFRDPAVYAYFDRLADDGFFDEFENVLFYGAGPCGYAAAAFSVTAPGARVVTINPQATLDPSMADWDRRYTEARRLCFTDRYGFAPEMIEAADQAFVLYSRDQQEDAMHATLFHADNVERLALPRLGPDPEAQLLEMQVLFRILVQANIGKLTRASFFKLMRARRNHLPYLRHLLKQLKQGNRFLLTALLCANVTARMRAPQFEKTLTELDAAASEGRLSA